jgi:hypothetical protein
MSIQMAEKLRGFLKNHVPNYWQESSRLSMLLLLAGWLALFYTRLTDAPVSTWWVWVFSALILFGAAYFGAHYRYTDANKKNLLLVLFPAFFFLLIISLQLIRYPYDWPFFPALIRNFTAYLQQHHILSMDFWHMFYLLILIWRGLVIGRSSVSSESQQKAILQFLIGIFIYQLFFDAHNPNAHLLYFGVLALLGLAGLPAARMVSVSQLRGGRLPKINSTWIFYILSFAGFILIAGYSASLLLNVELANVLANLMISFFSGFIFLLFLVLSPIIYLVVFLFNRLLTSLLSSSQNEIPAIFSAQDAITQIQQGTQEAFHHSLLSFEDYVFIAATIIVVLLILYTLKKKTEQNQKKVLLEEGNLQKQPIPKITFPFQFASLRNRLNLPPQRGFSAMRIRWIYAMLCYYGKLLGAARKPAVTPLEYCPVLYKVFPNFIVDINAITSAYIAVRYGNIPEDPAEMEILQQSWEQLEKEAHALLQKKTRNILRKRQS